MGRVSTLTGDIPELIANAPKRVACKRVLLASPTHFQIESAINPWMKNADGELKQVDAAAAMRQWGALKEAYEGIGVRVQVIDAPAGLPDFCFAANQSLAFEGADSPGVIMAHMSAITRRDEVQYFESWFSSNGFITHQLPQSVERFEGTGDAIIHPCRHLYWGGIGPRTAASAWPEVACVTGYDVIPLRLVDSSFYHLDTCFCPLGESSALYVPQAFDVESTKRIQTAFNNLHAVSAHDAANFACNAHSPDGKHVLMQQGSTATVDWLEEHGFSVIQLDTGEFMKSGGSVFCLKQELP